MENQTTKNILIVEDVKAHRELLAEAISDLGYIVLEAENGIEALDQLNNQEVDLIISDINMPEMNGFELLRHVRINERLLPFIFITALETVDVEEAVQEYDVYGVIHKPFSFMILKEMIENAFLQKVQ